MPNWRVYYGDGSTIEDDTSVAEVPTLNVQAIVQYDPVAGWYMQSRGDYYVYLEGDGLWQGVDIIGLYDYLQYSGWKRVLFGRTIRSEDYARIYQQALADRNELRGVT